MSLQTGWYEKGRVYIMRFAGTVTAADLQAAAEISIEILSSFRHRPVHSISDLAGIQQIDFSIDEILRLPNAPRGAPRPGWTLLVDSPDDVGSIVQLLVQRHDLQCQNFSTVEDALAFLNRADGSLPALLPMRNIFKKATGMLPTIAVDEP